MERPRRRLSVIVCLDIAGYSAMLQADELRTVTAIEQGYRRLVQSTLKRFGGRTIKTMGDGALIEFESAYDAVAWTVRIQTLLARHNASTQGTPMHVRAAIALADVIVTDEDRFGAAIGFVTRLQEAAPQGGIAITHSVRWQLPEKLAASFHCVGQLNLRSIPYAVESWLWAPRGIAVPSPHPLLAAPAGSEAPPAEDPRPMLVVLPFDNLSGSPCGEAIADGVVEEITATLSHHRDIRVAARNTAFSFKGRHMDVRDLARQLGVRYVLEGSLRRGGDRLRVTGQLIDATGGAHLWSGRFDGDIADILGFQDGAATAIAGAMHPAIRRAEIERAQRREGEGGGGVHDIVLRALPFFWTHRREDNARALSLLDEALAIAPRHGAALALKGWCLSQQVTYLWSDNGCRDRAQALAAAELAAETADPGAMILTAVGATLSILNVDQSRALTFIERALALDSTFSWAWTRHGYALAYAGRAREGLASFERALSLSPEDPALFNAYAGIATCHFVLGDYAEAVRFVQKALYGRPGMIWANRLLAAAAAHAGDLALARTAAQRLLEHHPEATVRQLIAAIHDIDGHYVDRYAEGLRLAGVPDAPTAVHADNDERSLQSAA